MSGLLHPQSLKPWHSGFCKDRREARRERTRILCTKLGPFSVPDGRCSVLEAAGTGDRIEL
jgi:hypothetical protein